MNNLNRIVPNSLTSMNLLLGFIAIVVAFGDHPMNAGYFIMAATIPDFLDGFSARLLNAQSEFGKQLDSLADMVSFGVAPSIILYRLIAISLTFHTGNSEAIVYILLYSSSLIALFSALRLARFNISASSENFYGLPTPASALLIASLGIFIKVAQFKFLQQFLLNPFTLLLLIVILSFLLISNIPMFSLKFKVFSIKKNLLRYTFLMLSLVIILITGIPGIAVCIILYVIISVFNYFLPSR
jgi:CDP-diacylglycerol---serine O-phosphatidyltransferase